MTSNINSSHISFTFSHSCYSFIKRILITIKKTPWNKFFSAGAKSQIVLSEEPLGGSPETWRHHIGNRWPCVRSVRKGVWPTSKTHPAQKNKKQPPLLPKATGYDHRVESCQHTLQGFFLSTTGTTMLDFEKCPFERKKKASLFGISTQFITDKMSNLKKAVKYFPCISGLGIT